MNADEAPAAREIAREVNGSSKRVLLAYLHGAARDGTFNRRHGTWRISQANRAWLQSLQAQIGLIGRRAWLYREGARDVWVLETKLDLAGPEGYASRLERLSFARGYFDAEGGIPRSREARFYIQFVQKDFVDLSRLRALIVAEGMSCGRLHNPSWRADPDFWRFYISARSHALFARVVGSWHPRKRAILATRFRGA